jgi:hypothetical protein
MLVRFFRRQITAYAIESGIGCALFTHSRCFCDDSGMAHRILRHLFLLVSLCIALAGCGYGISDGKLTMDFSPLQIQNAIAPKFPQENCPTPLTCIQLSNPKVTLPENANRIQLNFDTTVKLFQQPITGTAIISAQPRYQSTTGEIFFRRCDGSGSTTARRFNQRDENRHPIRRHARPAGFAALPHLQLQKRQR